MELQIISTIFLAIVGLTSILGIISLRLENSTTKIDKAGYVLFGIILIAQTIGIITIWR